jgi:hypothetical protein
VLKSFEKLRIGSVKKIRLIKETLVSLSQKETEGIAAGAIQKAAATYTSPDPSIVIAACHTRNCYSPGWQNCTKF